METLVAESDARIQETMKRAVDEQLEAAIQSARAVTERLTGLKITETDARTAVESLHGS